ncbi:MAG: DUF2891 domain-containing protein [Pseudomonadota bacterium]
MLSFSLSSLIGLIMKNAFTLILGVLALAGFGSSARAESSGAASNYESVFAELALACIHQEYGNKIAHVMNSDEDLKPPRELYPAFYGCYDWHSSVHGHWLLVRLLNTRSHALDQERIVSKLAESFTAENLAGELFNYQRPGMTSFERPYGIAWLLQLTAELRQSPLPQAEAWLEYLTPLETQAVSNLGDWLPKLTFPIRTGEHSQTAFAFGLMLDWSRVAGDDAFETLLTKRIADLYGADVDCPLAYEPSGQDFLSPCIAEADLMRRVLDRAAFAVWLTDFFPGLTADTTSDWLKPGVVTDKSDGKLAHLDGLNISRAWMLEGVISGLPESDPRIAPLEVMVAQHRSAGLDAVMGEMHYMGSHWLGSFATYLETHRGTP